MDANEILKDFESFLTLIGKSRGIFILNYSEEDGKIILRNRTYNKISIKVNKGSNTFDIFIHTTPYKNSNVEVPTPYKKKLKSNVNDLLSVVEIALKELESKG